MVLFFYLSKWILEGYNKHKRTHRASFIQSSKDVRYTPHPPTHQKYLKDYFMITPLITDSNFNKYDKNQLLIKIQKREG